MPTTRLVIFEIGPSDIRGKPLPAQALIAGSIDEVADQFRVFGELGYTDMLLRHLTNDQPKVLGSLERLGKVRAALA